MTEHAPFRILTVCTGNICRSPAAERLLTAGLDRSVVIGSAGTAALSGYPIDPPMASLLRDAGAEAEGFAARQVTSRLLLDADLVLALTRDHRARVVELAPGIVRRTHTLLEFARILGTLDRARIPVGPSLGARLRVITPLAAAMRPMVRRAPHETDDVPDPYRAEPEAYARSFTVIRTATDTIVRLITG